MYSKEETNGYLLALEQQARSLYDQVLKLDASGTYNDQAYKLIKKAELDLIKVYRQLSDARDYNRT